MAFSTQRGRPRTPNPETDLGTPELRLKHALRITSEPIDICLERSILTPKQHWCGLHLRWLYTLRYGAPNLTTRYADRDVPTTPHTEDPTWRELREQEYHEAIHRLKREKRYECIMRLTVFNEWPAFLNPRLQERSWHSPVLAQTLYTQSRQLQEGFKTLEHLWPQPPTDAEKRQIT